jgi:hypothetical protein
MLYRLRRRISVGRFNRAIRDVLATPPARVVGGTPTLVSMVGEEDVPMYLLSMKAFYRRLGQGRILAIVARAMSADARATLLRHFDGIELVTIEDIDTGPCQRGGCWERLLFILDQSRRDYVVQVDSDTLPLAADIAEVKACIEAGVAFTLVDGPRQIRSMREVSEAAKRMQTDYIGVVCERMFDQYPECDRLRYVRGSAALAGFPPSAPPRASIEAFHVRMESLIGPRWREWGTEQCASNFAVANAPGAVLLPHPAYTSFFPGGPRQDVKFFHFMGSFRFDEGVFAARAREEIAALLGDVRQRA